MTVYAGETAGFMCDDEDDVDGLPRCPLAATVSVQVLDSSGAVLLVETTMTLQVLQKGSGAGGAATGGSGSTIQDTGKAWDVNKWKDACVRIAGGTGVGQERRIKGNTATVITIDQDQVVNGVPVGAFSPAPDATSVYEVHRAQYRKNWDTPADRVGEELTAVFRARNTSPAWMTSEALTFRLEARSV
ncbi:MAG: hypothetical protein ABR562_03705 [Thermoplasmatota archaeon]